MCRAVYTEVRPRTAEEGGDGPRLYLLADRPTNADKSNRLRALFGTRPDEDLWVELAFYPSRAKARAVIRRLRKTPGLREKLAGAETFNRTRKGSWTVDFAAMQPV